MLGKQILFFYQIIEILQFQYNAQLTLYVTSTYHSNVMMQLLPEGNTFLKLLDFSPNFELISLLLEFQSSTVKKKMYNQVTHHLRTTSIHYSNNVFITRRKE